MLAKYGHRAAEIPGPEYYFTWISRESWQQAQLYALTGVVQPKSLRTQ